MADNQEVKDRILAVANKLYSENPTHIPKVADVRKLARSDMNTTSEVMKIWRENLQRKLLGAPFLSVLPIELQQEINKLTENLWQKLQLHANVQILALSEQLTNTTNQLTEMSTVDRYSASVSCRKS